MATEMSDAVPQPVALCQCESCSAPGAAQNPNFKPMAPWHRGCINPAETKVVLMTMDPSTLATEPKEIDMCAPCAEWHRARGARNGERHAT